MGTQRPRHRLTSLLTVLFAAACAKTPAPPANAVPADATATEPSQAKAHGLTRAEIVTLLDLGTSPAEVAHLIDAAPELAVTPEDLATLQARAIAPTVLAALQRRLVPAPSSLVDRLIGMRAAGKSDADLLDLVVHDNLRASLTADEKLALTRAGVGRSVVQALEGNVVLPGHRPYTDPLGILRLQHPDGWRVYEWYTLEGLKVLISPEGDVPAPNRFTTGVQLLYSFHGDRRAISADEMLREHVRGLRGFLRLNASYRMATLPGDEGHPIAVQVGGMPAVRHRMTCVMLETPCIEDMVRLRHRGVDVMIDVIAPTDRFATEQPAMARILATVQPVGNTTPAVRLPAPQAASDVLAAALETVVMVKTDEATGSGFFVHEDGLVLTNHHVVCRRADHADCEADGCAALAGQIEIAWDARVGPRPDGGGLRRAPATVVASIYSREPRVDLALLRVPKAEKPYRVLPLCSIESGSVRDGDPVVAFGFPKPNRFDEGNLFLTAGCISRINRLRDIGAGEVDDILTDAMIHGGNSGGPMIDLATGGVIGLCTFTPLDFGGQSLSYSGVCAIDHALARLPQLAWRARGCASGAAELVELGAWLAATGELREARALLERVQAREADLGVEQRARLHFQLAQLESQLGNPARCQEHLDVSLQLVPDYGDVLCWCAYTHASGSKSDRAFRFADRLVAAKPDDWGCVLVRADVCRLCGSLEQALREGQRAAEMAGDDEPRVLRLLGRVQYALAAKTTGDDATALLDRGLASFRRALQVDAADTEARLAVAEYHNLRNDHAAALVEYQRLAADCEQDPAVHEAYGRCLAELPTRRPDALASLQRAARLAEHRLGRAQPGLLNQIAQLATDAPMLAGPAIAASCALHAQWPAWRNVAHCTLGRIAMAQGRVQLGRAHLIAGGNVDAGRKVNQLPFALDDLQAVLSLGYSPALFREVLAQGALGFAIDDECRATLRQWRPWQQSELITRLLADQRIGSPCLIETAKIVFESKIDVGHRVRPWCVLALDNPGAVPLCDLTLRLAYLDKDNRVLWEADSDALRHALLPSHTKQTFDPFPFHPWAEIERHVRRDAIVSYRVTIDSARNASFLTRLQVENTADGYRIVNHSLFRVRGIELQCVVLDDSGKPIRMASDARPLCDQHALGTVEIDVGASFDVRLPQWREPEFWRTRGGPAEYRNAKTNVRVARADLADG